MSKVTNQLSTLFGAETDTRTLQSLSQKANVVNAPKGAKIFASGDVCENFVIVGSGNARVQLSTKTGREITLFRLEPGQSCALTTSCLLSETPYYAEGIAETDLELITIPSGAFQYAVKASPSMMQFLLHDYATRIAGLTALVDRLTSRDINAELASLLLEKADETNSVAMSHKLIADELGTAREVISRKLKDWERQTLVKLKRGCVILVEKHKIESYTIS